MITSLQFSPSFGAVSVKGVAIPAFTQERPLKTSHRLDTLRFAAKRDASSRPDKRLVDFVQTAVKFTHFNTSTRDFLGWAVAETLLNKKPEVQKETLLSLYQNASAGGKDKAEQIKGVGAKALCQIVSTTKNKGGPFNSLISQYCNDESPVVRNLAAPAARYITDVAGRDEAIRSLINAVTLESSTGKRFIPSKNDQLEYLLGIAQAVHYLSHAGEREGAKAIFQKSSNVYVRLSAGADVPYETYA